MELRRIGHIRTVYSSMPSQRFIANLRRCDDSRYMTRTINYSMGVAMFVEILHVLLILSIVTGARCEI